MTLPLEITVLVIGGPMFITLNVSVEAPMAWQIQGQMFQVAWPMLTQNLEN